MEPRFGRSFSSVRVHDGEDSAQIAASLQARAFTVGNDVFFGRGEFRPGNAAGRHLLAHELVHTVQQGSRESRRVSLAPIGKGLGCEEVMKRDESTFPPEVKPEPEEWFGSGTILDVVRAAAPFTTEASETGDVGGGRSNRALLAEGSGDRDATALLQRFLMWFHCAFGLGNPLRPWGALGVFGGTTKRMVQRFQSYYPTAGLTADGIVGPFTLDAMDRVLMGLAPMPLNNGGVPTASDEPGSLQWSLSGTVATALVDAANLFALARQVGDTVESVGCIQPLVMLRESTDRPSDFSTHYAQYVSAGDTFDFGMLTRAAAPAASNVLRLHFFHNQEMDAALAQTFWPGIAPASADVDLEIESAVRGSGDTPHPITELVLYGHAVGSQMYANGGPSFEVGALSRNRLPGGGEQSFEDAHDGRFTRNCLFSKREGTIADTIGCRSESFGRAFSLVYLRQKAAVRTTSMYLLPLCVDPALSQGAACTGYDSLGKNSQLIVRDVDLVNAIAQSNAQWASGSPRVMADPAVGPYFTLQDLLANATNTIPGSL